MPEEWRESAPFLHFFSYWVERYAILPLTTLAKVSREDAKGQPGMVSLELVDALAYAWDAAQAACFSSSSPAETEPVKTELPQAAVLRRIEGELDALRKAVGGAEASKCTPRT